MADHDLIDSQKQPRGAVGDRRSIREQTSNRSLVNASKRSDVRESGDLSGRSSYAAVAASTTLSNTAACCGS